MGLAAVLFVLAAFMINNVLVVAFGFPGTVATLQGDGGIGGWVCVLDMDNVTLLPHIGSATGECRADMAARALANIRAFLEHGKPLDPCTRPAARQ